MIDSYDTKVLREATHTIRITLMQDEYVGHIDFKIGGNCKGANVLSGAICFFEDGYMGSMVDNDCYLDYDYERDLFTAILHDGDGKTVEVSGNELEMENMVVSIEIEEVMPDA